MVYDGLGNSIFYKMMPVSACGRRYKKKTVGGDTFLVAKSVLFHEGRKTHQNITKWTMCQISM